MSENSLVFCWISSPLSSHAPLSPSLFRLSTSLCPCVPLPAVNSYGDDDGVSSSDSEDEVQKQFEISVSRSQSFRGAPPSGGEQPAQPSQLALGRRHKFTRLSDQEEGSTEPSDCEGVLVQSYKSVFHTTH